jgi:hypothetical protein
MNKNSKIILKGHNFYLKPLKFSDLKDNYYKWFSEKTWYGFGKKIPFEIYNNFFSIMFHPSKLPLFRGGEAQFKSKL